MLQTYLMKTLGVFILFLFAIFNISCTHKQGLTAIEVAPKQPSPFIMHSDIVYGSDSLQQSMDIYLPNSCNPQSTGVVILIHGGAWSTGSKNDFNNLGLDTLFTSRNFALVNINYRLDLSYPYPSALDDIDMIMAYVRNHAGEWNINPDKVCLFGRSSGAHLALQYAYTRNTDNRIKVVVDCFGPVNFTENSILNGDLGINVTAMLGPYVYNESLWKDASPINHMAGAVPTLIMHGTADSLVFPIQSAELEDSLAARNIPRLYLPWVGNGHGWNSARWAESKGVAVAWIKNFL